MTSSSGSVSMTAFESGSPRRTGTSLCSAGNAHDTGGPSESQGREALPLSNGRSIGGSRGGALDRSRPLVYLYAMHCATELRLAVVITTDPRGSGPVR